jgi:sterol desaturase/sphingolipid hydroxylase (fatty acid hydroxylase superfamily)
MFPSTIFIGLNLIPFLSLLLVKSVLPIQYKKKDYVLCFLYYYINVNILYSFLSSPPYERIIDSTEFSVVNILTYTLSFEGAFYIWHRMSHLPCVYRYLHSHHHVNYHVEPMDFIDVDYIDSLGFHVCMHMPLVIIPLHSLEYLTWYFVMNTSGFLLHSDLLGEHHQLHHKYFHCNYGFLIPVFDYAFGTYRHKKEIRL